MPPFRRASSLSLLNEIRFAVRGLCQRPGFALTCIATLALGIGASSIVFSVVNALLIRELPYAEPARLVAIWPGGSFANREIDGLRARAKSVDEIASFSPGWLLALTGTESPRQLSGARVSGNMFEMLGVAPRIGRTFGMEAEVPGNDGIVVLGYDLWQSAFSGDPAILGRSIALDGDPMTVVGVMPAGFQMFGATSDLWFPLTMDRGAMTWAGATSAVYGRLARGATPQMATTELKPLLAQLRVEFQLAPGWGEAATVVPLLESVVGGVRPMLLVLLAAVGFLLLISCANVASLLLVRGTERQVELSIRAALGASPLGLARLLLTESLVLGLAGGVLGVTLTGAGLQVVRRSLPANLPRLAEISLDWRVLAAAGVATVVSAVVFGLAPLAQGFGANLFGRLRQARGATLRAERARGALVAAEVALAVVLTAGAALMARTMVELTRVDPGLRTDHLLTLKLQPSGLGDNDAIRAYWRTVLEQMRALPGVEAAGTILHLPTSGRSWHADVNIVGRPLPQGVAAPRAAWQAVSTGYFSTVGVPLIRGRGFTASDRSDAPLVVLVNTALADQIFPGEDPVGKRITAGNATQGQLAMVIGVVGSVRHDSLNAPPAPELYVPFEQRLVVANSLVIRTSGDPLAIAAAVRQRIWSIDPNVPISDLRTMQSLFSASLGRPRLVLTLLGIFSGLGLFLGAVGIYGVVSYGVRQRRREIGIRVALGAAPGSVALLIVRQGIRPSVFGLCAGVVIALLLSRFLRGMVFGVAAADPASLLLGSALLLLVALGASALPARRAAALDPTEVLKE